MNVIQRRFSLRAAVSAGKQVLRVSRSPGFGWSALINLIPSIYLYLL